MSDSDDEDERPVLSKVRDAASSSVPADATERMLGAVPGVSALGRGPADGARVWPTGLSPSGGGLGRGGERRKGVGAEARAGRRAVRDPRDEPRKRRLRLPRMRVARRHQAPAPGTSARTGSSASTATSSPPIPFSELSEWSDFALEDQGRLTEPMVYAASDRRYASVSWADAIELVGYPVRGRIRC